MLPAPPALHHSKPSRPSSTSHAEATRAERSDRAAADPASNTTQQYYMRAGSAPPAAAAQRDVAAGGTARSRDATPGSYGGASCTTVAPDGSSRAEPTPSQPEPDLTSGSTLTVWGAAGRSLLDTLRFWPGALGPDLQRRVILMQVVDALTSAQARGVVHGALTLASVRLQWGFAVEVGGWLPAALCAACGDAGATSPF